MANIQGILDRAAALDDLSHTRQFDVLVIGGGATGLGVALDAASRHLSVALLERNDFAKGTSSRATKLVHGGVRYLARGNISLVREALRERKILLDNAPHLAQPLPFIMPTYGLKGRFRDMPLYGAGLMVYDKLAGGQGLGNTRFLDRDATLQASPGLNPQNLTGSVMYWDGQFDDARLAVILARTAVAQGAVVLNHCMVTSLVHSKGKLSGVCAMDQISGKRLEIQARCVINATGVWVDEIRRLDTVSNPPVVAPSQGIHLAVDAGFLPGEHALLVPKTDDGRVIFAVPWLGRLLLGTTDTPRDDIQTEPAPLRQETDFILHQAGNYLARKPTYRDIRSIWAGLRPLVKPSGRQGGNTRSLSREHTILFDPSGLVSITGGKWTTYRAMAEDVIEQCRRAGLIHTNQSCKTKKLPLIGSAQNSNPSIMRPPGEHLYGAESEHLRTLPGYQRELGMGLSEAMVRFAVRYEGARCIEDVLARRSRILFLDAQLASVLAQPVSDILRQEIGALYPMQHDLANFVALADGYTIN